MNIKDIENMQLQNKSIKKFQKIDSFLFCQKIKDNKL
jgi:hypothetical protein